MAFLVYLAVIFFCIWIGNVAAKTRKWLSYVLCIAAPVLLVTLVASLRWYFDPSLDFAGLLTVLITFLGLTGIMTALIVRHMVLKTPQAPNRKKPR
ncbi:MAG: hypothetical protein LAT77_03585 [Aliidiomarina sp.]|uniref:hypothetical protein n=1 Tax=Aliidiomarina sp. TaxID=1872439 RepID=UPI0025C3C2B8|nr:hypothetical protein [Aliidiomarina sp.]MCH8500979.1 hypothetical protein [Aliidiomarina sp.]